MRLPTFSRVTSWKMRAPVPSRVTCTAGSLVWLVEARLRVGEAVAGQHHLALDEQRLRRCARCSSSLPNGTGPPRAASQRASALVVDHADLERRGAAEDVLGRAVSCTPGSCTTTRSAPCCWITGSATPSSLTRLRRVVMFCWTRRSWMRFCASGLSAPTSVQFAAVGSLLAHCEVRELRRRSRRARASRVGRVAEAHARRLAFARDAAHDGRSSRAAASGCRPCSDSAVLSSAPSCRPAAGSARRRAGRGRGTSAARRSRSASAATPTAG